MQTNRQKPISELILELRGLLISYFETHYDPLILHHFKSNAQGQYESWSSDPPDVASFKDLLNNLEHLATVLSPQSQPFKQTHSLYKVAKVFYQTGWLSELPVHVIQHMQTEPLSSLIKSIPLLNKWVNSKAQGLLGQKSLMLSAINEVKESRRENNSFDYISPLINILQHSQVLIEKQIIARLSVEDYKNLKKEVYKINKAKDPADLQVIKSLLNSLVKLQSALSTWQKIQDKSLLLKPIDTGSALWDLKSVFENIQALGKLDPSSELYDAVVMLMGGMRNWLQNMTVQLDQVECQLGLKEGVLLKPLASVLEDFEDCAAALAVTTDNRSPFWDGRILMREEQLASARDNLGTANILSTIMVVKQFEAGKFDIVSLDEIKKTPDNLKIIRDHLNLIPLPSWISGPYMQGIKELIDNPRLAISAKLRNLHQRVAQTCANLPEVMYQRIDLLQERVKGAKVNKAKEEQEQDLRELRLNKIIQTVAAEGVYALIPEGSKNSTGLEAELNQMIKAQLNKPAARRAILLLSEAFLSENPMADSAQVTALFVQDLIQLGSDHGKLRDKLQNRIATWKSTPMDPDLDFFIGVLAKINQGPEKIKPIKSIEPLKGTFTSGLFSKSAQEKPAGAQPTQKAAAPPEKAAPASKSAALKHLIQKIHDLIKNTYGEKMFDQFVNSRDQDNRYQVYDDPKDPSHQIDLPELAACKNILNLLVDVMRIMSSQSSLLTRYKSSLLTLKYLMRGGIDTDKDRFLMYLYQNTGQLETIHPLLSEIIKNSQLRLNGGVEVSMETLQDLADNISTETDEQSSASMLAAKNQLKGALVSLQDLATSEAKDPLLSILLEKLSLETRKLIGDEAAPQQPLGKQEKLYIYTIDEDEAEEKTAAKYLHNSIAHLHQTMMGWEKIKGKKDLVMVGDLFTNPSLIQHIKQAMEELAKLAKLGKASSAKIRSLIKDCLSQLRPVLVELAVLIDQSEGQFSLREGLVFSQYEKLFATFDLAARAVGAPILPPTPFWREREAGRRELLKTVSSNHDKELLRHESLLKFRDTLNKFANTPLNQIPLQTLKYFQKNLILIPLQMEDRSSYESYLQAAIDAQINPGQNQVSGWVSGARAALSGALERGSNLLETLANFTGATIHSVVVDAANQLIQDEEKKLALESQHIELLKVRLSTVEKAGNEQKKTVDLALETLIEEAELPYREDHLEELFNADDVKPALLGLAGALFKDSPIDQDQFQSFVKSLLSPSNNENALLRILSEKNLNEDFKAILAKAFSEINEQAKEEELRAGIISFITDEYVKKGSKDSAEEGNSYLVQVISSDKENLEPLNQAIKDLRGKSFARSNPSLAVPIRFLGKVMGKQKETPGDILLKKIQALKSFYEPAPAERPAPVSPVKINPKKSSR